MNYTPEQHEAIFTPDRNLIVTAGAGSGKTRVLVERFVALLDMHLDWPLPSIVAITFTEKAAREMRDRVRQAIEKRIENAQDDASLKRWRDHQAALDSARIGTIHSLCTAILRANAAEVRIDPAFDVLDEADSAILRSEAIEQAVANLVEDHPQAARLLTEYDVETVKRVMRERLAENEWPEADDYLRQWEAEYENTLA